jgi:hypothetical protein
MEKSRRTNDAERGQLESGQGTVASWWLAARFGLLRIAIDHDGMNLTGGKVVYTAGP